MTVTLYLPTAPYRASAGCVSTGTIVGGPSAMGDNDPTTYARLSNAGQRVVARFPPLDRSQIPNEWELSEFSTGYFSNLRARCGVGSGNQAYIRMYIGYYPTMATGASDGLYATTNSQWINSIPWDAYFNYWSITTEGYSYNDNAYPLLMSWALDGDLGVAVEVVPNYNGVTNPVTVYDIYWFTTQMTLTWTPVITPPDDGGGGGTPLVTVGNQPQFSDLNSAWGDTWRGRIYSFTATSDSVFKLDSTGTVMSEANGYVWFDLQIGNDGGIGEYIDYWQLDYDGPAAIVSFGVRAGVKYHLTFWAYSPQPSDTFTFTATSEPIDTTPRVYRIAGEGESSIAPAGGDTLAAATVIHENQVSQATLGVFNPTPGRYEAWWKITPTRTGQLIFDSILSYGCSPFIDSSWAEMRFWSAPPGGEPTLFGYAYSSQMINVTAGYTYWILLSEDVNEGDPPNVFKYLRVSDYGKTSDWIDRGEQTYVMDNGNGLHLSDLMYHTYGAGTQILVSSISGHMGGPGYQSNYGISRSYSGPDPYTVYAAIECAWHHARVGENSGQTWGVTIDTTGRADYQWFDTGCNIVSTDVVPHQGGSSGIGQIGVSYSSYYPSVDFLASSVSFGAYGISSYVSLLRLQFLLTKNGGLAAPSIPYWYGEATIEYEHDHCTLTGLDVAADELQQKHWENENGGLWDFDGTTRWVGGLSSDTIDTGITWGPIQDTSAPMYSYDSTIPWLEQWNVNNGGPESLTYDFSLPDYSGGFQAWTPIDDELFQAAYALEKNDSAWYGPNELDFTNYLSKPRAGLKFVGISPLLISSTIPAEFGNVSQTHYSKSILRYDQCVALRVHVKPSRFRVIAPPTTPPVVLISSPKTTTIVYTIDGDWIGDRVHFRSVR